jgi:hypothetical protein
MTYFPMTYFLSFGFFLSFYTIRSKSVETFEDGVPCVRTGAVRFDRRYSHDRRDGQRGGSTGRALASFLQRSHGPTSLRIGARSFNRFDDYFTANFTDRHGQLPRLDHRRKIEVLAWFVSVAMDLLIAQDIVNNRGFIRLRDVYQQLLTTSIIFRTSTNFCAS